MVSSVLSFSTRQPVVPEDTVRLFGLFERLCRRKQGPSYWRGEMRPIVLDVPLPARWTRQTVSDVITMFRRELAARRGSSAPCHVVQLTADVAPNRSHATLKIRVGDIRVVVLVEPLSFDAWEAFGQLAPFPQHRRS